MRRKNKVDNCLKCNKEFNHYNYDSQEYCSKECYHITVRELRPKANCVICSTEIELTAHRASRNDKNYCSRECYNNRAEGNTKRLKRGTKYYTDKLDAAVCECGEERTYLLEIHHIDGNHGNNNENNLEIVCSNCHMKRHLKLNKKGKWVYSPKSLTDRSLLHKV